MYVFCLSLSHRLQSSRRALCSPVSMFRSAEVVIIRHTARLDCIILFAVPRLNFVHRDENGTTFYSEVTFPKR